ncbi:MAG: beta-ketoacyl-[acyl-carrier-protein] synthase family protein [Candidatus Eisenbacteria bacterium]|uniref:3-oxoacyl-[acyl-carrier-protein] synthase 1 n=1 Tax=Eiseniibacteriota bacterium TaxID=2212470 RepID=A0A956NI78_UNCEI|nr:beta-ketoacyl-[acyl-carrier-protein] synthase family protein [Candidatus Eisenbacteria bacterium]
MTRSSRTEVDVRRRVVVVGIGVAAPNGIGIPEFRDALRSGSSGVRFLPELAKLGFGCQVGGVPQITEAHEEQYFTPLERKTIHASGIRYGVIAASEAWANARLPLPEGPEAEPDWESGCVFGSGVAGAEVMRDAAYLIDEGRVKRLGSSAVTQVMASGISAYIGGRLGLGNQVMSNASACSTGTESLLLGAERIRSGAARRMICGATDSTGPHAWGGFDAMRVTNRKHNDRPEAASRPMSATASGFVPGGGAAALVLEELGSARERGATILAEFLGGHSNSGGQRSGGSMTAPNVSAIRRCLTRAMDEAGVAPEQIDAISGHLTATLFDPIEIEQWTEVLGRRGTDFPWVNSLKSLIGHCLSAAGAIESVASVLQLTDGFLHPSINCEDLHPEIAARIDSGRVPRNCMDAPIQVVAKTSFGFGDVNSCVFFRRYEATT